MAMHANNSVSQVFPNLRFSVTAVGILVRNQLSKERDNIFFLKTNSGEAIVGNKFINIWSLQSGNMKYAEGGRDRGLKRKGRQRWVWSPSLTYFFLYCDTFPFPMHNIILLILLPSHNFLASLCSTHSMVKLNYTNPLFPTHLNSSSFLIIRKNIIMYDERPELGDLMPRHIYFQQQISLREFQH